jgi:polyisoprenoid-binding protein YceI
MSVVENGNAQMLLNGSWQVDPAHSAVEFRVRHLMIATLKGRFREFDGAIVPGEALSLAGSIKVASVDTFDERRDEYLRSPDFFDVERYPEIMFRSTAVHLTGDDKRFIVVGELTMKDVTKAVTLDGVFRGAGVDPDDDGERIALELRGELDRTDFGLGWNRALEAGGVLFGNAVELALDVSAVRVD